MLNQEMRTVTMSRSDMLRVQQALTHLVIEYQRGQRPRHHRRLSRLQNAPWLCGRNIRNDFKWQMNEQDPEEFRQ